MQKKPFADLPATAEAHFKLYFYAAVLHIIEQIARLFGSRQAAFEQFPFLAGYDSELAKQGSAGLVSADLAAWWSDALSAWEETVPGHLPLRALREAAGLDHTTLTLLLSIGLTEEDTRFGLLFAALQNAPDQHRPTTGLLNTWWSEPADWGEIRTTLRRLQELGLVQVVNPGAPRVEWALQLPGLLWDILRGEQHEYLTSWARYHAP